MFIALMTYCWLLEAAEWTRSDISGTNTSGLASSGNIGLVGLYKCAWQQVEYRAGVLDVEKIVEGGQYL